MNELKPCPFCGSKPFVWRTNYRTYIECPNLTTESHRIMMSGKTDKEAIEAWNRRITMDVREKLVEILEEPCGGLYPACELADYLLDQGVTVQEWISVDERLPENFISVLGYMTDAGEFPPVRECYTVGNAFFFPALGDVHPVSHWCEMPEPPKGE